MKHFGFFTCWVIAGLIWGQLLVKDAVAGRGPWVLIDTVVVGLCLAHVIRMIVERDDPA